MGNEIIMNIESFSEKYKEKGGISQLQFLRAMHYSRNYIARQFGVTNNAVFQWGYLFPQKEEFETEVIIHNMMEFARDHSLEDFKFAFKRTLWYKTILEKVTKEIYGTK